MRRKAAKKNKSERGIEMKKTMTAVVSTALLMCSGLAVSEEEAAAGPRWIPVETWTCDFNAGKSMADLEPVIDAWSKWADKRGFTDYFASILTPNYYGELPFDIGWLGAWKDGNAMGAGTDAWVNTGGKVSAMFAEVITCDSHSNFVSTMIKPPVSENEEGDKTFVLDFTNCTIRDGQDFEAAMAGLTAWAGHQGANGFQNSTYMMFPVFGETNDDYSFKIVEGHDNHTTFGADYELMSNGGHWQKQEELLSGALKCDSPRVYDARVIREMADDEE
jgi:hypothetical protein